MQDTFDRKLGLRRRLGTHDEGI